MHRVELKVKNAASSKITSPVPNAPCGVESKDKDRVGVR